MDRLCTTSDLAGYASTPLILAGTGVAQRTGGRACARLSMGDRQMKKNPAAKTLESQIDVEDSSDVRYWCRKLGCAQSDLLAAVKVLGPVAYDVAKYDRRRAANQ